MLAQGRTYIADDQSAHFSGKWRGCSIVYQGRYTWLQCIGISFASNAQQDHKGRNAALKIVCPNEVMNSSDHTAHLLFLLAERLMHQCASIHEDHNGYTSGIPDSLTATQCQGQDHHQLCLVNHLLFIHRQWSLPTARCVEHKCLVKSDDCQSVYASSATFPNLKLHFMATEATWRLVVAAGWQSQWTQCC